MISPVLSSLGHTWIFDLDGTLLKHNGYKTAEGDKVLPGVDDFLKLIPLTDMIIIITSRPESSRKATEQFLREKGVPYKHIIFGAPVGERILVNDNKPSGLATAIAVQGERDVFPLINYEVDPDL